MTIDPTPAELAVCRRVAEKLATLDLDPEEAEMLRAALRGVEAQDGESEVAGFGWDEEVPAFTVPLTVGRIIHTTFDELTRRPLRKR